MCNSDKSPALAWAPSPKTLYIRRPLPWPRQGRRLGPPEVWNLLFHGHGPPLFQGRSTNNCLSVFKRFTKPQRRQPLRGSSSAGALTSHSGHSILLFRAFKLAICPPDIFPRAPNPSNPSAGLSKATLAATRHGHPVFKGVQVQACRLPGPKPFKPSRKPFEGNSRNCTPGFKPFLRPFQGNSEPAVARLQTLPQAFPRQLSQLQGATRTVEVTRAICFTVCHGPSVLARAISFSCTVSQRACHA